MLSFIALFIVPVFGLQVLPSKKQRSFQEMVLDYLSIMVIANLLSHMVMFLVSEASQPTFTVLFFIKYVILNLITSILASLAISAFRDRIVVEVKVKKDASKK